MFPKGSGVNQEEIENRLRQIEVDLIRLDAVTENTANTVDRLAGIVLGLGEKVSGLAEKQKQTDETVAILAKSMVSLTESLNRFIGGQHNGDRPR